MIINVQIEQMKKTAYISLTADTIHRWTHEALKKLRIVDIIVDEVGRSSSC